MGQAALAARLPEPAPLVLTDPPPGTPATGTPTGTPTYLHMISWVRRTRHISGFLSCPS